MDQSGQNLPLLNQEQIIKPGQVPNLGFLTLVQKQSVQAHVTKLWQMINSKPTDHPDYLVAHRELSNLSHQFRIRLTAFKQQQQQQGMTQQQQHQAQLQSHAQMQAQNQMNRSLSQAYSAQHKANAAPPQPTIQFSDKVKAEVMKFNPAVPQEIQSRPPEEQKKWVQLQRTNYANLMAKWENESKTYEAFRARASQTRNSMTEAELERAKVQVLQLKQKLDVASKNALQFKLQHDPVAAETYRATQQARAAQIKESQAQNNEDQKAALAEASNTAQTQVKQEDQDGKAAMNGQDNQEQPVRPPAAPLQTTSQNAVPAGQPQPLTHQAALASARSYSQPVVHTQPAQNQPLQKETVTSSSSLNNFTNKSRDRTLVLAPVTPVPMPPARPTLTGGQGPQGQMGQPALQKVPAYNAPVEGEGHVLSRNKLRELAREVTGGAAGDDALDPDVEEILLEVADEFVDTVTAQACELAKARGSDKLEIRDIQVIIERNYNIRVPGFGSDELRTVKRIVPTPAWTQKMSAVQAAKMSNGKNEP